jgi:hypothetical protein
MTDESEMGPNLVISMITLFVAKNYSAENVVSQGSDARCLVKDYVPFLTYVLPASA